jgi:CRP/FNR family transcriptional regulator, cyclic AMP receptor protein
MSATERQGGQGDKGEKAPSAAKGDKGEKAPGAAKGKSESARKSAPGAAGGDDRAGGEPPGSALDILANLDLFRGLAPSHLTRLVTVGAEERHSRGAKVFDEGEKGDRLYVILDGSVRISRFVSGLGEEALAVLRPGTYFGEMSLIDDEARSAAAIAHESCRLFVLKRSDLEDLLFVDRDLAYDFLWNLVRTLSRRLRATNDKMTFLAATNKF